MKTYLLLPVLAVAYINRPHVSYGSLTGNATESMSALYDQGQEPGQLRWEPQFTDAETGQAALYESLMGHADESGVLMGVNMQGYYLKARELERDITGEPPDSIPDARFLITCQSENNLRIQFMASHISHKQPQTFYMIGKNFIPNGLGIALWYGNEAEYSSIVEDTLEADGDIYVFIRMSVTLDGGIGEELPVQPEKRHWNLGDTVERKLNGVRYRFQCVDQNYSDRMENHKPSALFLCMSVIPADLGSEYRYEELLDGTFDYVFYPGPLVNFGQGHDYKDSAVRKWLKSCEHGVIGAADTSIGVDLAYTGSTEVRTYKQLDAGGLKGEYIGYQEMTDKLFILSVDEALKYREYLWRFEGAQEENPESQYGAYSKGYWLRNPCGDSTGSDTGLVYAVDLVNGNIRPQPVKQVGSSRRNEPDITGTTGVRPAFALPQDS